MLKNWVIIDGKRRCPECDAKSFPNIELYIFESLIECRKCCLSISFFKCNRLRLRWKPCHFETFRDITSTLKTEAFCAEHILWASLNDRATSGQNTEKDLLDPSIINQWPSHVRLTATFTGGESDLISWHTKDASYSVSQCTTNHGYTRETCCVTTAVQFFCCEISGCLLSTIDLLSFFIQTSFSRVSVAPANTKHFITFVQRRPTVFDVGPSLYKCYKNVLCLLGRYRWDCLLEDQTNELLSEEIYLSSCWTLPAI